MKKYAVTIPYPVWVTVEVEADDKDSAIELAFDDAYITGYIGNGGCDKLIGVSGSNVSIEAGEEVLEIGNFKIEVDEI